MDRAGCLGALLARVLEEGFADGLGHHSTDGPFFPEFDLALGGVDVDVDGGGVDFEEQAADGIAALHEGGVVTFDEGVIEAAVFDGAPVDEEVLLVAGRPGGARGADQSPEPEVAGDGFAKDRGIGIVVAGCFLDQGREVDGDPLGGSPVELAEAIPEGVETLGGGGSG